MTDPMNELASAYRCALGSNAAPGIENQILLAGTPALISVAGAGLGRMLLRGWSHLIDRSGGSPELSICGWDEGETGVHLPESLVGIRNAAGVTYGEMPLRFTSDRRFAVEDSPGLFAMLDRERSRLTFWCKDYRNLPAAFAHRPLQRLLRLWFADRGVLIVHGGLVSMDGKGVLIAGPSGAGKSTVSLACLLAGWSYLGDDFAAVELLSNSNVAGYSTYGSFHVFPDHQQLFESVANAVEEILTDYGKRAMFLAELFPDRLSALTNVHSIVLPRISAVREPVLSPASATATISRVMPSTLLPETEGYANAFNRLTDIVSRLPRYWLDLGGDLGSIAKVVSESLD